MRAMSGGAFPHANRNISKLMTVFLITSGCGLPGITTCVRDRVTQSSPLASVCVAMELLVTGKIVAGAAEAAAAAITSRSDAEIIEKNKWFRRLDAIRSACFSGETERCDSGDTVQLYVSGTR